MGKMESVSFTTAKPVWAIGREFEKNLTLGFRTCFEKSEQQPIVLRLTASSMYRFFVNGEFAGCGPARGPHGYYRVDEWNLSEQLVEGKNSISIEVAGYNVNSYYLLDQPSFLQAELTDGAKIIAATGIVSMDFEALEIKERVQKVQRYSFQRTFVEAYKLDKDFDAWKSCENTLSETVKSGETSVHMGRKYLPRNVEYPGFAVRTPLLELQQGTLVKVEAAREYFRDRALINIGTAFKGYYEDELECCLSKELDEIQTTGSSKIGTPYDMEGVIEIEANTYRMFDFGLDLTGFIGFELECKEDALLYSTFDEILVKDDIDYKRNATVNSVKLELRPGIFRFETMEPYTLRFLKLSALQGNVKVKGIQIREYAGTGLEKAGFESSSEELNRIFMAGAESFRQNAVDIFMDCPSRERAGWLCDSFFTSRVEFDLTGQSLIEKNFIENYLLPDQFDYLPEGMLPMCYPADHNDGNFIPNWALWFVLQLEEYLHRSGDSEMVYQLKEKVYRLFHYFEKFENEYGLLEKLAGWIYVDSSRSNDLVHDVNYPTNMLYAHALECAGRVYSDTKLKEKAKEIRKIIREQAFDGEFFIDNAMRENGRLRLTQNKTEACQYYAFFFGIATPDLYPELWKTLVENFGPKRKETGRFPEVSPTDAFMGNYLRLETLSCFGGISKAVEEIKEYFTYMQEETGTLWEHDNTCTSCNHGFASHVVHSLYRDLLGIKKIDNVNKVIEIMLGDTKVDWCEGYLPIKDGRLSVKWKKENGIQTLHVEAPLGYKVNVL